MAEYLAPMQGFSLPLLDLPRLVDDAALATIFAQVASVVNINALMLSSLETRYARVMGWLVRTGRGRGALCRPWSTNSGRVATNHFGSPPHRRR